MALITCPHCKSKNISDYKTLCPVCGSPLSNFDDRAMAEKFQAEKNKRNSARLKAEAEKQQARNERLKTAKKSLMPKLKKELDEIDIIPFPDKPRFIYAVVNKGGLRISLFLLLVLLTAVFYFFNPVLFVLFLIASSVVLCYILIEAYLKYQRKLSDYYQIADDFDGYKEKLRNKIIDKYDKEAINIAVFNSEDEPDIISQWS